MSLHPSQYSEGRRSCFKVEIENIDSRLISILFSPHLADLQPEDPASKFSYFELQVSLSMGGRRWETSPVAGAKLYGKEDRPETIFTLHPGEGVRIVAEDNLRLTDNQIERLWREDPIDHANAQPSLDQTDILIVPKAST